MDKIKDFFSELCKTAPSCFVYSFLSIFYKFNILEKAGIWKDCWPFFDQVLNLIALVRGVRRIGQLSEGFHPQPLADATPNSDRSGGRIEPVRPWWKRTTRTP